MELGGGGWSWMEVRARFSNTHKSNEIKMLDKILLREIKRYNEFCSMYGHYEFCFALPKGQSFCEDKCGIS